MPLSCLKFSWTVALPESCCTVRAAHPPFSAWQRLQAHKTYSNKERHLTDFLLNLDPSPNSIKVFFCKLIHDQIETNNYVYKKRDMELRCLFQFSPRGSSSLGHFSGHKVQEVRLREPNHSTSHKEQEESNKDVQKTITPARITAVRLLQCKISHYNNINVDALSTGLTDCQPHPPCTCKPSSVMW